MSAQIKNRRNAFGRAFAVMGAAIAASAAVENHRRPAARHLDVLGIDPKAFYRID